MLEVKFQAVDIRLIVMEQRTAEVAISVWLRVLIEYIVGPGPALKTRNHFLINRAGVHSGGHCTEIA